MPTHHSIDLSFLSGGSVPTGRLDRLIDELREAVRSGRLRGGTHLPPSRQLAGDIRMARSSVATAYERLTAEGYLMSRQGAGTWVAEGMTAQPVTQPILPRIAASEISICRPSLRSFPIAAWRRATVAAASRLQDHSEGSFMGDPALRAEVAAYVGRARGLHVSADNVMITRGGSDAIALAFRHGVGSGERIGIEDPGFHTARQHARSAGADPIPLDIDADGLTTENLPKAGLRAVYVTPSHQFPTGVRMPVQRRQELLAWARSADALIVEDDYDGEFRYDVPPLPPLASLDEGLSRVAYVGTFSKSLSPALRLGYLIAPVDLLHRAAIARRDEGDTGQPLLEAAMAYFIRDGELDRHVRRMRRHYATIRADLVAAIRLAFPAADIGGLDAGLHFVLSLGNHDRDRFELVARQLGVHATPLATFAARDLPAGDGDRLVVGYGPLERDDIARLARIHEDG